jgi:hypothetical protein
MASPTAAVITATGISAPTYAQIYAYFQSQYLAIFGADALITPDTQDGQMLAVFAQAVSDSNAMAIAVYNSFSPATAQGTGLSSNVQINGLQRLIPSFSTAPAVLVGVANAVITNGNCTDANGNIWNLPASVQIGLNGTIAVTVTCATVGAIPLVANGLTIGTPTFGWTGVTNSVASVGSPVETDAELRVRQAASVALPSQTIFEGITAAIAQVAGVTRVMGYENNTPGPVTLLGATSQIPANSLDFIVEGGLSTAIMQAIFLKIAPGIPTWNGGGVNNISEVVTDSNGSTRTLNFQTRTGATMSVVLTLHQLSGWAAGTEALIQAALAAYFAALPIGSNISYFGLIPIAALQAPPVPTTTPYIAPPQASTFTIKAMTIQKNALTPVSADIQLNYNEATVNVAANTTFLFV